MRYFNTKGFILKRNAVKENDLFLTIFSKEKGKIQVFAKHSKSIKSKFSGKIEPLSLCHLEIYQSPRNYYLQNSKLLSMFDQKDTNIFYVLSIISEILNKLLPENEANPETFELIHELISSKYITNQKILICTLIKILKNLGYLSININCLECNADFRNLNKIIINDSNHFVCHNCTKSNNQISHTAFKALYYMLNQSTNDIQRISIPEQNLLELFKLLTEIIQEQVQSEIKSKSFISLIPHS